MNEESITKKILPLEFLENLYKELKFWKDRHILESDTSALDEVLEEIKYFYQIELGTREYDEKYPPVIYKGKQISLEDLEGITIDNDGNVFKINEA